MKLQRFFSLCLAFLTVGTMETQAQSLGDLFKKAKKTVEAVTGSSTTTSSDLSSANTSTVHAKEIMMAGGGTMTNPLAGSVCDIELVGLYGKGTSLNYGTVTPVFKVRMVLNEDQVNIGFPVAFDQDGNTYKPNYYNINKTYDVTEGIFVKIVAPDGWIFKDVKKTATTFSVMKMDIFAGPEHKGTVVFKNIPIQWNVKPQ